MEKHGDGVRDVAFRVDNAIGLYEVNPLLVYHTDVHTESRCTWSRDCPSTMGGI